ncbi:all-beta uncharacterized protein [Chitinophaga polysaccharea]|uniref:All-beta uncharacterized protein n=1 Tax=Chitinophaga polysaccharea TaxID=1293035 RepID=A0A561PGU5_9BACT|nr:BACON domain-containing protein [Chitinophaga polysaccharea]TWF37336.1 all-beta uncharacterized protein [Chitinophaga polysaccharea]
MKHLMYILLVISLMSCGKDKQPVKPQPSPFSAVLENNANTFPASGGTANIVISAGADGWWITLPASNWCNVGRLYGSGDVKVPVTIKPNTSGAKRNITITVKPTFNLSPVTLTVEQLNQ